MAVPDTVFQPILAWKSDTWQHMLWIGTSDDNQRKREKEFGTGFSVEEESFPCNIGKLNLGCDGRRSLMTSMRFGFCSKIWSSRHSRLTNNKMILIIWSFAMYSIVGIVGGIGFCIEGERNFQFISYLCGEDKTSRGRICNVCERDIF